MPVGSASTFRPKTRVAVRLKRQQLLDISKKTNIPYLEVLKYSDKILNKSMAQTIQDIIPKIHRYAPKATGQLRNSLEHFLKQSRVNHGKVLLMKFGTYIGYMKYVAGMSASHLKHPKAIKMKYPIYQRNSKHGKKGQAKRNPGLWRYVKYYGGPRWVRLDDPIAQKNFYSLLIRHIRDSLLKHIVSNIQSTIPKGIDKRQFTSRMRPKTL